MHPTLQEVSNGLVHQMLLIGPWKVLQWYTRYLKNVSIFLSFLLSSVVYYDFSKSLPRGLKNKVLCSQWFGWKLFFIYFWGMRWKTYWVIIFFVKRIIFLKRWFLKIFLSDNFISSGKEEVAIEWFMAPVKYGKNNRIKILSTLTGIV